MSGQTPDPASQPELNAVEETLRHLVPAPARLDRDRLLFRAGQRAAPRRWFWPVAAVVSTAACAVLAVVLACRPAPAVVERIVYVPEQRPAPVPPPDTGETSLPPRAVPARLAPRRQLEERLLNQGLDGLGEPPPPLEQALTPLFFSSEEVTP
jgi:hypothetical protein